MIAGQNARGLAPALDRLSLNLVLLALAGLCVVIVEPAPSDVLFACAMLCILVSGRVAIPSAAMPVFICLGIFAATNLISAFNWRVPLFGAHYMAVTLYILMIPVAMMHVSHSADARDLNRLYTAFLIGATASAAIGVAALIGLAPGSVSLYFRSEAGLRLSPLFKDPNVFGPYMASASIIALARATMADRPMRYYALAVLFAALMTLSFSRGAWLGFAVSCALFVGLSLMFLRHRTYLLRVLIFATLGMAGAAAIVFLMIERLGLSDFLHHRAALQVYDGNRFDNWMRAFDIILDRPFGVGPGHYVGRTHFAESEFGLATHNLYLKVAVENGWLGFTAFLAALAICLAGLWSSLRRKDPRQPMRVALFALLTGQLVNSMVVDSLHWRHLFVVLGLALCEMAQIAAPGKNLREVAKKFGTF